jgi:large subunit ribosomal protein L14e
MTCEISLGQVVRSKAGRDKDSCFLVWEILNDSFVYLVDGDLRKVENPKRKNIKHLQKTSRVLEPIAAKLKAGEKVTNAEIRRSIADLEGMGDKNC